MMYSPFHKLLIKSEGTFINEPLLSYYFLFSYFYSLLSSTLGCFNCLFNRKPIYNTSKIGERVPALNVVREVEEMLEQHGFLSCKNSDKAYNCQNNIENFSFDFSNIMKNKDDKFIKCVNNSSDGDTTFITEETHISDDDISLSDLDEFVTLMKSCPIPD